MASVTLSLVFYYRVTRADLKSSSNHAIAFQSLLSNYSSVLDNGDLLISNTWLKLSLRGSSEYFF